MAFLSEIEVTIDGEQFRDFIRISISQSLYKNGQFTMVCRFDAMEDPDTFLIQQSHKMLGKLVVIKTKAREFNEDETKEAQVFRGIITHVTGAKTGMAEGNQIILRGGSPEILLNRKPVSRVWLDVSLKDVVSQILQPYDASLLNPNIEPRNKQKFSYIVQYEESDLDFLRRLSVRYGEWFYYTGERLVFGELLKDNVDLTIGIDAQEMNFSVLANPLNFSICSSDLLNRELYEANNGMINVDSDLNSYGKDAKKTSLDLYPEKGNDYFEHISIAESDVKDKISMAGELIAKADAINLTRMKGSSKNPFIRIGWNGKFKIVKGKERGVVDYGEFSFTAINFLFDNILNYWNDFLCTPSTTTIPENTDPYYVTKVHPQLAVVKDNKDPEKLGRIKVWFAWMPDDQVSPWIHMITPYAEKSSGFYFVPSIGTAVLVGYEAGDIERPFCMGTLYEKTLPPEAAWAGNFNDDNAKIHAIRTFSGNTVEFHDADGEEKIRIYDAGEENEIVLDSANKNLKIKASGSMNIEVAGTLNISAKNIKISTEENFTQQAQGKASMSADMDIEINAAANYKINAAQNLELQANGGLKINSDASVEISGLTLKADGKTSAELSSAALAVVKAAMVKIN